MEDKPGIHWRSLQGRWGGITYQLMRFQVAFFRRHEKWVPAVNAFRCRDGFVICVELAGMDRAAIDLRVEPQRVLIRGQRAPAEPGLKEGLLMQVLALEIDHGPFEREVVLPSPVRPERVQAEQRNGLLWIYLPASTAVAVPT